MIALVLSEIKKLFKNKLYLLLFLLLLILPTIMTLQEEFRENANILDGKNISGYDVIQKKIEIGKSLSGEVTEEWLESQKERLKENDGYETIYIKQAIDYGNFVQNQEWKNYDGRKKYYVKSDEKGNPIFEYEELNKEMAQENAYVKQKFQNIKHFYYGETYIIPSIMKCLANIGAFLAFYILVLFTTIFNKEEKDDRKSLMKSTKLGKRKLIIAKILATILISILAPIIIIAFVSFFHILLFGFPNWNASFQIFTQTRYDKISPFTLGEAFLFTSGLYIVGSIVIGILSMLLSSTIRSSYRSLIIGFIFLILPMFLNVKIGTFSIKNIFPLPYMNTGYEMLINLSTIQNYTFYDVLLVLKTGIISIFFLPIIYFINRKELSI